MTILEGQNVNQPLKREPCLLALHHNRPVQSSHFCKRHTNPTVDLLLHSSLTYEQDPTTLRLLHLREPLIPNPETALDPFLTENRGLRLGGSGVLARPRPILPDTQEKRRTSVPFPGRGYWSSTLEPDLGDPFNSAWQPVRSKSS